MTMAQKTVAPLVSVVVVAYNRLGITKNCLNSIMRQTYARVELVVVDNGSDENIADMVRDEFPEAHLIRLRENTGFASGHNRGMELASGKYVAIINNDAVADPGWVESMVRAAEDDDSIGSVASVILDSHEPNTLDSCGIGIGLDGMSRQAMMGKRPPTLTEPREVLLASGCACMFRKEALESAGMFDESFFAYCEDTDLGLRLRWVGYRCVVSPGALVTHHYSMTTGKFSLQKVFWVERNHYWVAFKNFPAPLLMLLPVFTAWRFFMQSVFIFTKAGSLDKFTESGSFAQVAGVIARATIAAFSGMPGKLSARVTMRRSIGTTQMLRLIFSFRLGIREILIGNS